MTPADPAPAAPVPAPAPGPARKPKRWPIGLLVGFICGIVGAVITAPISDWAMEAHHVSNFEGGRGYAVVCFWIPLGFMGGCVVGFVVSLLLSGAGFVGYAKRQGVGLGITGALVLALGWLGWATADHPPLIDGKNLALDIELRVPAKGRTIEQLQAEDFDMALTVSASDRSYCDMRWSDAKMDGEFITVRGWASLNSRDANREITAGVKEENRQRFHVMLPRSPRKIEEAWTEWAPAFARFDGSKPAPADQYQVRYRVRFAEEYSPTPTPTPAGYQEQEGYSPDIEESATPEESPTPDESPTPAKLTGFTVAHS